MRLHFHILLTMESSPVIVSHVWESESMDAKLKHLEFIQAAIGRMSTNSSLFKGWAITIAAALTAFAAVDTRRALVAIALVSTALFWGLDGYYLWLEHGFVKLHNEVAARAAASIDFKMQVDKTNAFGGWLTACIRCHLVAFYGAMLLIDIVGIILIKDGVHHGS